MVVTFLPFPSFRKCAKSLDRQRLGKQRAECVGIYNVLTNPNTKGNPNIPQVRMWAGCELALLAYTFATCREWQDRGYNDSVLEWCICQMPPKTMVTQEWLIQNHLNLVPSWLGAPALHSSHRSRLVCKDWSYYAAKLGWLEEPGEYFWPGSSEEFKSNYGESGLVTTLKGLRALEIFDLQTIQNQLEA